MSLFLFFLGINASSLLLLQPSSMPDGITIFVLAIAL